MRAVVQRVSEARVTVGDELVGAINAGLVVLLGVGRDDAQYDVESLAEKIVGLRVFDDAEGKMNLSIADLPGYAVLVVSQFTLFGDCRKGRRPSYIEAAAPELAQPLYEAFVAAIQARGIGVATGRFRAMMQVHLVNDGPVTLLLDTKRAF